MKENEDSSFSGVYGLYTITLEDKQEVKFYRISLLFSSLAFSIGLIQWIMIGPTQVWIWLLVMAICLGASLKWIHIYLRSLHNILKIFWGLGFLSITAGLLISGPDNLIITFTENSIWTISLGPLFAALTGLGFKEFFCFRRPEAIGLTLLIPIALLGHLTQLFNGQVVMSLLIISAISYLFLALRKFGIDASLDIGDKSVFEYLDNQKKEKVA